MSLDIQQASLFDYASLDADTYIFVQQKAQAIHARLKRTAEDIIAIGEDLLEVKERLRHGQFLPWLQSEFEMSQQTASRFMQAATRKEKLLNLGNLSVSVLYELASPATPEAIIEQVETKQIPATLPAIREAKRELQQTIQQTKPVTVTPVTQPIFVTPASYHEEVHEEETAYESVEDEYVAEVVTLAQEETIQLPATPAWDEPELQKEIVLLPAPTKSAILTALQSSESNEWYTPVQYVEAARDLMSGIDVDPASNAFANEKVQATTYYDIETNGLDKQWIGRIWLNPPYGRDGGDSNQEIWTRELIEQFTSGSVTEAVLLVNANTEAKWFQPLWQYPICFTDHRIRFYTREGMPTQPTQGNAFVYFGKNKEKFAEIFKQFGAVILGPVIRRAA